MGLSYSTQLINEIKQRVIDERKEEEIWERKFETLIDADEYEAEASADLDRAYAEVSRLQSSSATKEDIDNAIIAQRELRVVWENIRGILYRAALSPDEKRRNIKRMPEEEARRIKASLDYGEKVICVYTFDTPKYFEFVMKCRRKYNDYNTISSYALVKEFRAAYGLDLDDCVRNHNKKFY
jgi:hypothetical protein